MVLNALAVKKQQPSYDSEDLSDDEFDEDEFVSNKELVFQMAVINANIALNVCRRFEFSNQW